MSNQTENTTSALDTIVWGADAIAPHLGRTVKGAYGALEAAGYLAQRRLPADGLSTCAYFMRRLRLPRDLDDAARPRPDAAIWRRGA
jgi:hypothetical protein